MKKVHNNFKKKITPSLQKKIDDIMKEYDRSKKRTIIQAYISKGGYFVIEHKFELSKKAAQVKGVKHIFIRDIFGVRGGWNKTEYFKFYDYPDKEPYGKFRTEQ